jgi:hypothetical protein
LRKSTGYCGSRASPNTRPIEVKSIAVRVEHLFLAIQEAAARKDLDRLITNVDRLQREVGAGNAMLDRSLNRENAKA